MLTQQLANLGYNRASMYRNHCILKWFHTSPNHFLSQEKYKSVYNMTVPHTNAQKTETKTRHKQAPTIKTIHKNHTAIISIHFWCSCITQNIWNIMDTKRNNNKK
eukprot:633620_1